MSTPEENLPREERMRRFKERWAHPIPDAPPKLRAIVIVVDAQTAANAKARPESIRIATRGERGLHHLNSVDAGTGVVGWMQYGRFTPEKDEGK
jgi:hypothetical protein